MTLQKVKKQIQELFIKFGLKAGMLGLHLPSPQLQPGYSLRDCCPGSTRQPPPPTTTFHAQQACDNFTPMAGASPGSLQSRRSKGYIYIDRSVTLYTMKREDGKGYIYIGVRIDSSLRASLSGTFLQTLPELVTRL